MVLRSFYGVLVAAALAACGGGSGDSGAAHTHVVASSGSLSTSSGIACASEVDCAVCYRASTCGEPIHAGPGVDAPECHASPAAFCMPRRAHCDEHHCVAR